MHFTKFVAAIVIAGSLALTPAPAKAGYSHSGDGTAAILTALLVLIIVGANNGFSLGTKNEATSKASKGKILQKF